jgi:hypothetical protein
VREDDGSGESSSTDPPPAAGHDIPIGGADPAAEQGRPPKLVDTDAPVVDPAAAAALCAALGEDRSAHNLRTVNRLGLEMSSVRVEGSVGLPVTDPYGNTSVPLEIEKVWVGPTFLEGTRTLISMDAAELAGFEHPGRYIVGFGSTVSGIGGSDYPARGDAGAMSSWDKEVIIPAAERDDFADWLSYGIQGEALVAVVEVADQNEETSRLAVIETLGGDVPPSITVHWNGSVYDANFPGVDGQRYLATFRFIHRSEPIGADVGVLADFRPYDAAARRTALAALAAPRPERDLAALVRAAREYRSAWTVHRAPLVVATQIGGIAHECCSGAGGTYYSHDVIGMFRGDAEMTRVMLGGHDYFSEERCGESYVLALSELEGAAPAGPASSFACGEPNAWPSVDWVSVPRIDARFVDSEVIRAQVERWLRSPEPRYLLRRESDTRPPFALGPDAVWSQPIPIERALSSAPLYWVDVVGVSASTGRVMIETSFSPWQLEHLPRQRFELDAECIDPLLARGGRWLVPVVMLADEVDAANALIEPTAFIIPGVVLPNHGYIRRIVDRFLYASGAKEAWYADPG